MSTYSDTASIKLRPPRSEQLVAHHFKAREGSTCRFVCLCLERAIDGLCLFLLVRGRRPGCFRGLLW
jgi:hypothetical protein